MKQKINLTDEQTEALNQMIEYAGFGDPATPYVLHGLAGTGKTSVLSVLSEYLDDCPNGRHYIGTLTGKAASVIHRKTGRPANTLHSIFKELIEEKHVKGTTRKEMTWADRHSAGALAGELLLADEVSMIDKNFGTDIMRTGIKVIAIGDPGQLPPIKGDPFFNVPNLTLKTVHRQALESPIIRQAHNVRNGVPYVADTDDFQIIKYADKDMFLSVDTVLCWTNATRHHINTMMRQFLGFDNAPPQPGEMLMCLKNSPVHGVFNGAQYRLLAPYNAYDYKIRIDVDGRDTLIENASFEGIDQQYKIGDRANVALCFGYASTVHKYQGSEADTVLLIDEYSRREDREKWLYTGITRAVQRCVILKMV